MGKPLQYKSDEFASWEELKDWLGVFGLGYYIFRGESGNYSNPLKTSLERAIESCIERIPSSSPLEYSGDLFVSEFRREAYLHAERPITLQGEVEWLALMQHHGAPTRLLDWTRSRYVAAFFALEDAKDNDRCVVWALNYHWLWATATRILESKSHELPKGVTPASDAYHAALAKGRYPGVFPIEPYGLNQRMSRQKGLFLMCGDPQKTFLEGLMDYDQEELKENLHKIVVPSRVRQLGLRELNEMGIDRSTLFPGLDGFAQTLKNITLIDYW